MKNYKLILSELNKAYNAAVDGEELDCEKVAKELLDKIEGIIK